MFISVKLILDCKTVSIFAYSSTCEQSNKGSGTRLKTESETEETEARTLHTRTTFTPRLADFSTDFEKKPTVLQSTKVDITGDYSYFVTTLFQHCCPMNNSRYKSTSTTPPLIQLFA